MTLASPVRMAATLGVIMSAGVIACAPPAARAQQRGSEPVTPAVRVTDGVGLWGVQLGRRLRETDVAIGRCMTGREFAFSGGGYAPGSDVALYGATVAGVDSARVLRNLDRVDACLGVSTVTEAAAIVTVLDTAVIHAVFVWIDSPVPPSLESLAARLTTELGAPRMLASGTRLWPRRGMEVRLAAAGPYGQRPHVTVTSLDGRAEVERTR